MGLPEDPDRPRAARHRAMAHEPGEAEQQQTLRRRLVEFVQTAQARGIHPLPLETYHGPRRYWPSLSGWLLFPDTVLVVGTDAELYRLPLEGGLTGNRTPIREEWIRSSYWRGWSSRWVTLDVMLIDAVARGTGQRMP